MMMALYLILDSGMNQHQRSWMNRYGIPLSLGSWLNIAAPEDGTCMCVKVDDGFVKQLQPHITTIIANRLEEMRERLDYVGRRKGKERERFLLKLRVMEACTQSLEVLGEIRGAINLFTCYTDDESADADVTPDKEPTAVDRLMGIDREATQDYLLGLVKKNTLH